MLEHPRMEEPITQTDNFNDCIQSDKITNKFNNIPSTKKKHKINYSPKQGL